MSNAGPGSNIDVALSLERTEPTRSSAGTFSMRAPLGRLTVEQYVLDERPEPDTLDLFYDERYQGKYRWRFPHGKLTKVGFPRGSDPPPENALERHSRTIPIGPLSLTSSKATPVLSAMPHARPIRSPSGDFRTHSLPPDYWPMPLKVGTSIAISKNGGPILVLIQFFSMLSKSYDRRTTRDGPDIVPPSVRGQCQPDHARSHGR